jgi:creatinine amidohydrolase
MSESKREITGILEEMTIEQVRELRAEVVVLPIGSTEPHGPHLPYGTDTFQADAVTRRAVTAANRAGGRVLMYPALPIGNNVNFKAFPFAARVSVRTLMNVVLDIVEALEQDSIKKIVLVNSHGGNTDTLKAAIREHVSRHPPDAGAFLCMVTSASFMPAEVGKLIEHGSDHAGEYETSCVMHLRPELVRQEKFDLFPQRQPELPVLRSGEVFFVRPWHGYVPASAGGETRKSTAEKGKALIDGAAQGLAKFLVELSNTPWQAKFPYAAGE